MMFQIRFLTSLLTAKKFLPNRPKMRPGIIKDAVSLLRHIIEGSKDHFRSMADRHSKVEIFTKCEAKRLKIKIFDGKKASWGSKSARKRFSARFYLQKVLSRPFRALKIDKSSKNDEIPPDFDVVSSTCSHVHGPRWTKNNEFGCNLRVYSSSGVRIVPETCPRMHDQLP